MNASDEYMFGNLMRLLCSSGSLLEILYNFFEVGKVDEYFCFAMKVNSIFHYVTVFYDTTVSPRHIQTSVLYIIFFKEPYYLGVDYVVLELAFIAAS